MMTDLHHEAARIVQKFNLKEGFIKNLVYSSSYKNLRQLFALVSETIKYQFILKDILKRSGSSLLKEELVNSNNELAVVLLYEELIGAGFGRAGFVRKTMRKHKAEIKAAHEELLKEKNATSLADVLSGNSVENKDFPVLPRYVRVNLIKCTVQKAVDRLCQDGWEHVGQLDIARFKESVSTLNEYQFGLDPLLEDVLVFPFGTDLHKDKLVTEGVLVLQERASCVPAHVLNPPPGSLVLDCCAAPGNKTSHLASLMRDHGHVIALDRDARRVSTMNCLLQKTGATCVETIAQDFLTLSPESDEVAGITMILLDPSCSCTGMPTGTSYRQEVPLQRLQSLKRYQISLLKHALRFPNVQRVVYSTCSTSRQENEEVVEEIMCNVKHRFRFLPVLPDWPNSRGMKKFLHHKSFLRVSPEEHLSAGFFVACFERIKKTMTSHYRDSVDGDDEDQENGIDGVSCNVDVESKMAEDEEEGDPGKASDEEQISHSSKRKKKHRLNNKNANSCNDLELEVKVSKKKKKEKDNEDRHKLKINEIGTESIDCGDKVDSSSENVGKKRKKRDQSREIESKQSRIEEEGVEDGNDILKSSEKKKKRKKYNKELDEVSKNVEFGNYGGGHTENVEKKKKKKKHKKEVDESTTENVENENFPDKKSTNALRKKKKKDGKKRDNA